MPANELKTDYERWLYVLKHLANLKEMPESLKRNKIFKKLFMEAELAGMTPEELDKYDESLKNYRDMYTVEDIMKDWKKEYKARLAEKDKELAAQAKELAEYRRKYGVLGKSKNSGVSQRNVLS